MTVRQTSARDLETGDIFLETVTAIGTETAIDIMRPRLSNKRKRFDFMSYQYPLKLYKYSSPSTLTQLLSFQGQ